MKGQTTITKEKDFYTHWTYMLIFRRIFLRSYWWQKSDIWSQASYRYPILLIFRRIFLIYICPCICFLFYIFILSNVLSFYLCVTCLKQCWRRNQFYYSILFIYYLLDNSLLSYMSLYQKLWTKRQSKTYTHFYI
jgi:hypothetical protein